MDLVVYDDDEKRYVPWAVALTAALLVALLTAALTFVLARQASGDEGEPVGGVTAPEAATSPSAEPSPEPSAAAPSAATSSTAPAPSPARPSPAAPSAAAAAPTPAPACVAALLRADAVLERSVAVDEALAEHTRIMDELLGERITAPQALDQTLPVLTDGATERRRLEEAAAGYREAREECPS